MIKHFFAFKSSLVPFLPKCRKYTQGDNPPNFLLVFTHKGTMSPKQSLFYPTWYYTCNAKQGENHSIILELKHNVEECDLRTLSLPYKESNGSPKTILLFAIGTQCQNLSPRSFLCKETYFSQDH